MYRVLRAGVVAVLLMMSIITPLQALAGQSDQEIPQVDRLPASFAGVVDMDIIEVAGDFTQPVHVTNAGDGSGRLFVSDRSGVVWILEDGVILTEPFLDISDVVRDEDGEQGFFAVAFHPNFTSNGYVYAVYTKQPTGANVLARFEVPANDPNHADPGSLLEILVLPDRIANHNGGDLAFGPDGYLYIGTGDEGGAGDPYMNAQDPQSLFGKMLRLDVDSQQPYAIPPDNPFVEDSGIRDEIWAFGLRNPWRFSFDALTGDMYIGDVGQNAWEEIDFEPAGSSGGLNYGWPIMEGFACYPESVENCDTTGMTDPVLVYSHDGEPGQRDGCSVTGGEVYRGLDYPFMDGAYIFADWCEGRVWAGYQDVSGWQKVEIHDSTINWTDIGTDEAGELYGVDMIGGRLFRFVFAELADPVIESLTPGGALVGGDAFTLTLRGAGFDASRIVMWNDAPLQWSFVDSETIVAEVPAAHIAEASLAQISLRDPMSGAESVPIPFRVAESSFAGDAFELDWSRTDQLVAEGDVLRTWIWGPAPNGPSRFEPYVESRGGYREVLYFDKSRMEITHPDGDEETIWYVTNGLLVVELMTGDMQIGDDTFVAAQPAQINVAGDAGDADGVTYATLADLREAPALPSGALITTVLASDGSTSNDGSLAQRGVRAGPLAIETGHRTASVFWDFMTSDGLVLEDGVVEEASLFENPYFATGFPITGAYWTEVEVGGTAQQVLLQCFERRCLTYTPQNALAWQVEAGNVGLHYQRWRYGQ